jgi:hypothetical protein
MKGCGQDAILDAILRGGCQPSLWLHYIQRDSMDQDVAHALLRAAFTLM